jgi:YD repeat-containing protein
MLSRALTTVLAFGIAADIVAQCTITLDLQRYPTEGQGDHVVATATNGAGCSEISSVIIRPLGATTGFWAETYCNTPSCTATSGPRSLACWPPGEYIIEASGHCKAPDGDGNCVTVQSVTTTATITIEPYVASLSVGQREVPNAQPADSIRWILDPTYSFPNTGSRSITYHDAKTSAVIPYACDHCDAYTCTTCCPKESDTCTTGEIWEQCGREIYVQANICHGDPTKSPVIVLAPTDPTPGACSDVVAVGRDCQDNCPTVGHPINVGSGEVLESLSLFTIDGPSQPLEFAFKYHSALPQFASLSRESGQGWTHSFGGTLRAISQNWLYHIPASGAETLFHRTGPSTWEARRPTSATTIVHAADRYEVRETDGTVVSYDASTGRWVSTADRWGNVVTAQFDTNANLVSVTDALGRVIQILEEDGLLRQLILPGGATWTFAYVDGALTAIHDPLHPTTGPAWRSFAYTPNSRGDLRLLTSMTDDSGTVLAAFTYAGDRATSSSSVDGTVTIQYDTPGVGMRRVTHVIDASTSQVTDFTMAVVNNQYVATNVSGSGCATCSVGAPGDTLTYNTKAELTQRVDAAGARTTYTYDAFGNVLSTTEAAGTSLARTTTFVYGNPAWPALRTSETIPGPFSNRVTERTLSTDERTLTEAVTGRTSAGGAATTYATTTTFDARHRLTQIDGPRTDVSDIESRSYYADDDPDILRRGRLRTITSPTGLITTFEDYDVYGTARRLIDANGVVTTLSTDPLGRTTGTTSPAIATDPNEATASESTTTYDSDGRITRMTTARGTAVSYQYEPGTSHLTDTITIDATGNQVDRLHVTYNAIGWKTREEAEACATPAASCSSWITKRSESFVYDDDGHLVEVVHADNTSTAYSYDAVGRIASVRDETHTSPNTTYAYDILGRLTSVTQTLAEAPGGAITTIYGYNNQDQLTSVTDPNGNTTTYEYDDFGRLIRQTSPVAGTTTYAYDAASNLITTTDANGATTSRSYDASNRVTSASSSRAGAATETVTWAYDDTTAGNYGRGRLATMSDPSGSTSYAYERRGLLRRETKSIDGSSYTTLYGHDANGNRSSITYPSGRIVAYSFDHADRPVAATNNGAAIVSNAKYAPFGPLTELSYANGTSVQRTYDLRYRMTLNKATGAGTIAQYDYGYDAAGNITSIADTLDPAFNRAFGYDDLHRLHGKCALAKRLIRLRPHGQYDPVNSRRWRPIVFVSRIDTETFSRDGSTGAADGDLRSSRQ